MGKSSGSIRARKDGGLKPDQGGNYKGEIGRTEPIANIQNTQLRREIQQGISKYESRLGVRQTNVQLASLEGAAGVHVTVNGQSSAVYLNSALYKKGTPAQIIAMKRRSYDSGFLSKTNKPVQHTVVHELGHATWNRYLTSSSAVKARPVIEKKFREFQRDFKAGRAKGYGSYATENVNEFWAEATTKAVLGRADKYTRFVKSTVKKYNL